MDTQTDQALRSVADRVRRLENLVLVLQDRLAKLENPSAAAWAAGKREVWPAPECPGLEWRTV